MDIPKILEKKLEKPVAIFGGGVSGKAVEEFLRGNGFSAVIYDRVAEGAGTRFDMAEAARHELVVCSPGFPHSHPWKETARRAGLLCLCEPDFAALFWQGALPPLRRLPGESAENFMARANARLGLTAVTGTNGKTTLTEFLAFALRRVGRDSLAVGNNGVPMTRMLAHSSSSSFRPVCEISSFQAEELRYFSPRCVLWTNFDEDHIDRHGSAENYFRAKFRLVECLENLRLIVGDFPQENDPCIRAVLEKRTLIVGESVPAAAARFGIALPAWTQVATRAEVAGKIPVGSIFATFPQAENYAIARRFWLSVGLAEKDLESAALAFPAREHRLAQVRVIGGGDAGMPRTEFWGRARGNRDVSREENFLDRRRTKQGRRHRRFCKGNRAAHRTRVSHRGNCRAVARGVRIGRRSRGDLSAFAGRGRFGGTRGGGIGRGCGRAVFAGFCEFRYVFELRGTRRALHAIREKFPALNTKKPRFLGAGKSGTP